MRRAGTLVDLSPTEYRILEYLIHHPRKIVSKRELLEHLRASAEACGPLPFYVYEFAGRSGYSIPVHVIDRLRETSPNLAGLKVSDTPWSADEPYALEGLDLFSTSSRIAGVGPAINLPIFEAGRLRANLRGSYAEYDTAVADYNQALINALRQVADQITSLRTARERLATQALALAAANDAYRLTLDRYRSGLTNYLDVLINEQRLLAERLEHVRLEGQCLAHAVQTIRALGGGCHVPPDVVGPAAEVGLRRVFGPPRGGSRAPPSRAMSWKPRPSRVLRSYQVAMRPSMGSPR